MTVTIVCVCGHHNAVPDEDLERASCGGCLAPLLRPAQAAEVRTQPVTLVAPSSRPLFVTT
jgi:hypothetical protein